MSCHNINKPLFFLLLTYRLSPLLLLSFGMSQGVAETVRFVHCLGGCPAGAPADNHVIARSLYTLSYNANNKVADWVAYLVTPGSIGVATNLSRQPLADPYVDQTLQPQDFDSSEEGGQLALSAFAPLVSFAGTPYWLEINYLTNMAPRHIELNRGSWYGLEWAIRNYVNRSAGLYVVTGPIYDGIFSPPGPAQTTLEGVPFRLPSGFFKVASDNAGNVAAFTFPQDLPFHVHHCDRQTSLEEVERLTGLDLFPERTQMPAGDLGRALGCFR